MGQTRAVAPRWWPLPPLMDTTTFRSSGCIGLVLGVVSTLRVRFGLLVGVRLIGNRGFRVVCCIAEETLVGARVIRADCLCSVVVRHGFSFPCSFSDCVAPRISIATVS